MLIHEIAKNHIVEKMINKIADASDKKLGFLKDLSQDIYEILCQQRDRIENMPTTEQLLYIQRVVYNNLKSKTSRYFYNYKRYEAKKRKYKYDGSDAGDNSTDI